MGNHALSHGVSPVCRVVGAGAAADLLPQQATCHPAFIEKLEAAGCDANRFLDRVVVRMHM
eukprot:6197891-Pleurochrysis_carterae.AAC.2